MSQESSLPKGVQEKINNTADLLYPQEGFKLDRKAYIKDMTKGAELYQQHYEEELYAHLAVADGGQGKPGMSEGGAIGLIKILFAMAVGNLNANQLNILSTAINERAQCLCIKQAQYEQDELDDFIDWVDGERNGPFKNKGYWQSQIASAKHKSIAIIPSQPATKKS